MFRPPLNRYIRPAAIISCKSTIEHSTESKKTEKKKCFLFKNAIIKDFLDNTSLHGLNYLGSTQITLFERIFFGLAFLLVLFCSVYFISDIYIRWSKTPVIVSYAPRQRGIRSIPFPAVTICNHNKARISVIRKIANASTENAILESVCYSEYSNITVKKTWNEYNEWKTVRQYLLDISQPCQEMLQKCKFGGQTIRCMSLFDTVLTDEGVCCSFNTVEPQFLYQNPMKAATNLDNDTSDPRLIPIDWTPDTGYANKSIRGKAIPRPPSGSGRRLGLYLVLNANVSDYFCSSTNSVGFKILLHSPIELPRISYYGMLLHPGRETQVVISPKVTTTTYQTRKTAMAIRGCAFPDEIQLKFFRTYSRKNCEMECFSQAFEQECGCVMYYMPRLNQNGKICTRSNFDCYNPLRISLERAENSKYQCSCYPACDSLSYSGEVSASPLIPPNLNARSSLSNFSIQSIRNDIAIVEIYYTSFAFEAYVKDEFIGLTEFLSNTGGLLCLFMGFSAVSLVEIFYFMAFRSYCNRHTNQDDNLKMQTHNPKPNNEPDALKLAVQNKTRPYIRMYNRTYLTGYVNNQTVLYRRNY